MEYQFSERVKSLKPSAIREILKNSSDPSVIPLSAGNPAPDAFPYEAVRKISQELLQNTPIDALQYGVTEGYTPLRQHLMGYMAQKHHVGTQDDDILITSGAQQVMDLLTKTLLNEGDTVLCEAPSFIGSLNTFRSYRAKLVGIPMEEDGIDTQKLEEALNTEKNVKYLYTIPNFQNPSGITMSLEKRKKVYELCREHNVIILEDNPYGDLRFAGKSVPAIKTLDTDGHVLYAGTFSKTISPGMRVGFAAGGEALLQKMTVCKQGNDVHTNIWSQLVIHRFLHNYDFEAHLKNLQAVYAKKYAVACRALQEGAPMLSHLPIEGGLFLWCTLPDAIPMRDFCMAAIRDKKVCVVPGNAFLPDESLPCQSFRINYSSPTDADLDRGIRILGQLAQEWPRA